MPLFLENGQPLNLENDLPFLLEREVYDETSSGGIAVSGISINRHTTHKIAVASGLIYIGGCSGYNLHHYAYYDFSIGSELYNRHKANKGIFEKIVIKDLRFPKKNVEKKICNYCDFRPLYVDTLNALWNEEDLVSKSEAEFLVALCCSRQFTINEKYALNCDINSAIYDDPHDSLRIGGCADCTLTHAIVYKFAIGSIVFNKIKAQAGKYEKIVIEDVRFPKNDPKEYPIYVDTLHGLWNEGDLVSYAEAKEMVDAYLLAEADSRERSTQNCRLQGGSPYVAKYRPRFYKPRLR